MNKNGSACVAGPFRFNNDWEKEGMRTHALKLGAAAAALLAVSACNQADKAGKVSVIVTPKYRSRALFANS